jgi:hypothetical protein
MKQAITTFSIIIIVMMSAIRSYGQHTDSLKVNTTTYLSQYLKADTSVAKKVIQIQEEYKKAVKQIVNNSTLTEQQKRSFIDGLIDQKNSKLEKLLTLRQRDMIVPTSERRHNWKADTTSKKNL